MKTKKHGNGLNHFEVVRFSNRLAAQSKSSMGCSDFERGWMACARYYAHELRIFLRDVEHYSL